MITAPQTLQLPGNTGHIFGESETGERPHSRLFPNIHFLADLLDYRWRIGRTEVRIVGRRHRFLGATFVTRQGLKPVPAGAAAAAERGGSSAVEG